MSSNTTSKHFISIAALSAMLATILGAFAAHLLKGQISEYRMNIFQTGVLYQLIHSLALFGVGLLLLQLNKQLIKCSGWLFLAGIFFFSGSLYLISMLQIKAIGMITPLGGLCFILGWLSLAIGVYKAS